MRQNGFGESYAHTADEARKLIDEAGEPCYVTDLSGPESCFKATAEIRTNVEGNLVCFLEADTLPLVQAMVDELRLNTDWGTA